MCEYCETTKEYIENHNTHGIEVNVCTDCAIRNGYRTVDWYKDNEHKLDFDWKQI
jgi:sulfur relay (sulfurtransferase) complex TusBCD TusD component (DsrE family)